MRWIQITHAKPMTSHTQLHVHVQVHAKLYLRLQLTNVSVYILYQKKHQRWLSIVDCRSVCKICLRFCFKYVEVQMKKTFYGFIKQKCGKYYFWMRTQFEIKLNRQDCKFPYFFPKGPPRIIHMHLTLTLLFITTNQVFLIQLILGTTRTQSMTCCHDSQIS